jgi:hypothetical protein
MYDRYGLLVTSFATTTLDPYIVFFMTVNSSLRKRDSGVHELPRTTISMLVDLFR